MNIESITFGEVLTGLFSLGLLVVVGALLAMGSSVPDQLWLAFTLAAGYILGSRTSQPDVV